MKPINYIITIILMIVFLTNCSSSHKVISYEAPKPQSFEVQAELVVNGKTVSKPRLMLVEGDEGADDRQRLAAGLWIHGDFICAEVRKGCQFMQT